MRPPVEVELRVKRAVENCARLIRNSHLSLDDILEDSRNSSDVEFQKAADQLNEMKKTLKKNVEKWLETGDLSGFLSNLNEDDLLSLMERRKVSFKETSRSPRRNYDIPTLDMSSLRIESPEFKEKRTSSRNTPTVSEIPPFEDIEVVEVSDSSACESHHLNQMADQMMNQLQQVKTIPSSDSTRPLQISNNLEFPNLPLNFIPSSPLVNSRTTFTKSREVAVQTLEKSEEHKEMIDAATSFNSQKTLDEGEVSTSASSDPSLGQIDHSRMETSKIVSVLRDGSILNPKHFSANKEGSQSPRVSDVGWKAPLDVIRIAERDISSSFGSDKIETVSANLSARSELLNLRNNSIEDEEEKSFHSDDEETMNQVSPIDSEKTL